jgi:C1A family cysteine protease
METIGFGWVKPTTIDIRDYHAEDYLSAWQKVVARFKRVAQIAKVWDCARVLDQGSTGHCVGFSGADFENTLPVFDNVGNQQGHALYYACKEIDGEPKAEDGSSVHSLAKVLKKIGRIKTYAFTSSLATIKTWLLTKGSVICGVDWYSGMMNPGATGFVYPTGAVEGGHAFILEGYDPKTDAFTILNSWSSSWSQNGRAKIKANDFAKLLPNGEAMIAVELP